MNIEVTICEIDCKRHHRHHRQARSATLHFKHHHHHHRHRREKDQMNPTITVGQTATAVFTEYDGLNGTGNVVAPIQAPVFSSDNTAVAAVDSVSGVVTGVGAGTANISAIDNGNGMTATASITVGTGIGTGTAQSATLVITPDSVNPQFRVSSNVYTGGDQRRVSQYPGYPTGTTANPDNMGQRTNPNTGEVIVSGAKNPKITTGNSTGK